ncbi:hypothetical protein BCR39DRAFT_566528 [Naematelia encephala]|uniref:GRIP domain-containing protein n=1 Tax=Naematelia encephala TaxID=71784 RepID=A0A1Y2AR12_9TREE|nr:hypothetical protein BCR39DRAFT_566528 [Naematelia encephala]
MSPPPSLPAAASSTPRSSLDHDERLAALEQELATTRQEKEVLSNQYRSLLGKLTAMRSSLGEKLREDAEELDRRETVINNLQSEKEAIQASLASLRAELVHANAESANLATQLAQLRSQSDSSSSDVLSLTREMRELRGEMERLRVEREEWEGEAGRERERREMIEDEMRAVEKREREGRREWERGREEMLAERERARNLQDVLGEFQAAKDSELRQATAELETQLRLAATSLSEFKLRAANAETQLSELGNDRTRSTALEKELKEKNQIIAKLRHDAVVNNEHLTEALRRLRKNSSDNNVDRRLVTNILLSFLTTHRADSKRFEMLSLLSTILSWDDAEREKAGLQRMGGSSASGTKSPGGKNARRESSKGKERSAEEEAAMNESFSNLFVEFLLKEASQGQSRHSQSHRDDLLPFSPIRSPPITSSLPSYSPPHTGTTNTPASRMRRMSSSSNVSISGYGGGGGPQSPPVQGLPVVGAKGSWSLQQAMNEKGG